MLSRVSKESASSPSKGKGRMPSGPQFQNHSVAKMPCGFKLEKQKASITGAKGLWGRQQHERLVGQMEPGREELCKLGFPGPSWNFFKNKIDTYAAHSDNRTRLWS